MRAPNIKGLLDEWNIKHTHIQAGEYKTALDPLKEIQVGEIAYMQAIADDIYKEFVDDVATHRLLDKTKHELWANGRIFTGNQALKLGLIDEIGSYSDALSYMAQQLEVVPEDIKLHPSIATNQGLLKRLLSSDENETEVSFFDPKKIACFVANVYRHLLFQLSSSQKQINL